MPISVKVNVSRIDKTRLHKGERGTYLELILIERADRFGNDYMVCQGLNKEDRDAGLKGAILGNARNIGQSRQGGRRTPPPSCPRRTDDDAPF